MGIEFNNLKMYRKKNKFTQEQVAERLGVSRQAVAKWERGESLPDIENCIALADMYEVSIDSLVRNLQNLPITEDDEGKKHIFGVSRVTDKGQITLPKKCREVFNIQTGDSILFLGDTDRGIALIKLGKII